MPISTQSEVIESIPGGETLVHQNPRSGYVERFILQNRHIVKLKDVIVDTETGISFDSKRRLICETSNYSRDYLLATAFPRPWKMMINKNYLNIDLVLANNGYWHWLVEDLPNFLRAKSFSEHDMVLIGSSPKKFVLDFISMMNLRASPSERYLYMKELVTTTFANGSGWLDVRDYNLLRQHFADLLSPIPIGHKIYASRRNSSRSPGFEIALENELQSQGWKIVFNEHLSFSDQISLYSNASVVCGVGGSNLANIIWSPKDVRLIELSPKWFSPCFSRLSQTLDISYLIIEFELNQLNHENILKQIVQFSNVCS